MSWKKAFDVINRALTVIHSAGSIPGVNLIPYVGTVTAAAGAIQAGMNAAVNVAPYVKAVADTFAGGLPSEEQLQTLDQKIKQLEAKVAAKLPPPEPGEPD